MEKTLALSVKMIDKEHFVKYLVRAIDCEICPAIVECQAKSCVKERNELYV